MCAMCLPVPMNVLQQERIAFTQNVLPADQPALPVPHPTKSIWIDSPDANPNAKEGSTGELTKDADICIIGSGITGISAAYFLAKAIAARKDIDVSDSPFKVVILEARDFCEHV